MKSIILLIDSLEVGGAENSLISLANELSNEFEVSIISLKNKNKFHTNKISFFSFNSKKLLRFNNFFNLIKVFLLKKNSLILSFSPHMAVMANIANTIILKKHKTALSFRNSHRYYSRFNKLYCCIIYSLAIIPTDSFHFLTESNKKSYLKLPFFSFFLKKRKTIIIPNFIRSFNKKSFFSFDRNEKKEIIFVGRLDSQKKPFDFIHFCKYVEEYFPNEFSFSMFGEGKLYEKLFNNIKNSEIYKSFTFYGKVKDIESYLKNPVALIFTSDYEGHPGVIGEAVTSGIPVFSYPYDSFIKEFINFCECSKLSEECNPESLFKTFKLNYKSLPISYSDYMNDKKKVLKKFSKRKIINLWKSFIN